MCVHMDNVCDFLRGPCASPTSNAEDVEGKLACNDLFAIRSDCTWAMNKIPWLIAYLMGS